MSFFGNYFRKAKRTFREAMLTDEIDEMPLCSKPKLTTPTCYTMNEEGFESTSESNYQGEEIVLSTLGRGFASRAATAAATTSYSLGNFPWVCPSGEMPLKTSISSSRSRDRSGMKIRVRRPFYRPLDSTLDSSSETTKPSSNIIQVLKELTSKTTKPNEAAMDVTVSDTSKTPSEVQHNLFMPQLETKFENVTAEPSLNENVTVATDNKFESPKRRNMDSSLRDEIYSSLSSSMGVFNGKPIQYVGSSSPKPKKAKRLKTKTSSIAVQTIEKPRDSMLTSVQKPCGNDVFESPSSFKGTLESKENSPVIAKVPPLQPTPVSETTAKVILKSALSKFQKSGLLEEGRPVGLPTIGPPVLPEYEKQTTVEKVAEDSSKKEAMTFPAPAIKQQDPPPFVAPTEPKLSGFQLPTTTTSSLTFNFGGGGLESQKANSKPEENVSSTNSAVSASTGFQFSTPAATKTTEIEKLPDSTKANGVGTTPGETLQSPRAGGFTFKAPSEQKDEPKPENKSQGFTLLPPATSAPFIPSTTPASPPRVGGFSFTPTVSKSTTITVPVTTPTSIFAFGTSPAAVATTVATTTVSSAAPVVSTPPSFNFTFGNNSSQQQPAQTEVQSKSQGMFSTQTQQTLSVSQPATTSEPQQAKEPSKPIFSFGSDNKFSFSTTPSTTNSSQSIFNSTPKFSFSSSKIPNGIAPKLDGFPPVSKEENKPSQSLFSFGGTATVTTQNSTTAVSSPVFSFGGSTSFGANPPSFTNQQSTTNSVPISNKQPTNPPSFGQQPSSSPAFGSNPPAFGSTTVKTTSSSLFPAYSTSAPAKTTAPFSFGSSTSFPLASTTTTATSATSSMVKPNESLFKFGQTNGPTFKFTPTQDKPSGTLAPSNFGSSAPAFGTASSFGASAASSTSTAPSFSFGGSSSFGSTISTTAIQGAVQQQPPPPAFPSTASASTSFGSNNLSTAPPSFSATTAATTQQPAPPPSFGQSQTFSFGSLAAGGGPVAAAAAPAAGPSNGTSLFQFGGLTQPSNQQPFAFSAGAVAPASSTQGFGFPATGFAPVGGAMFNIGSGTITPRSRQRQRKK